MTTQILRTDRLRRVSDQRGVPSLHAVYIAPDTDHWADWRDAQAVVRHGTLHATRCDRTIRDTDGTPLQCAGDWIDADGRKLDAQAARALDKLKSIGIATK